MLVLFGGMGGGPYNCINFYLLYTDCISNSYCMWVNVGLHFVLQGGNNISALQ